MLSNTLIMSSAMANTAYIQYYTKQAGGGMQDIGPIYFKSRVKQRGRGIGNIFGSIYRFIKPLLASLAPALRSSTLSATTGLINDIGRKSFKESLKDNSKNAMQTFLKSATQQSGSGRSRKSVVKKKNIKFIPNLNKLQSHTRHRKGNVNKKNKKKTLKKRVLDIFSH